jgi:hypothetical protein
VLFSRPASCSWAWQNMRAQYVLPRVIFYTTLNLGIRSVIYSMFKANPSSNGLGIRKTSNFRTWMLSFPGFSWWKLSSSSSSNSYFSSNGNDGFAFRFGASGTDKKRVHRFQFPYAPLPCLRLLYIFMTRAAAVLQYGITIQSGVCAADSGSSRCGTSAEIYIGTSLCQLYTSHFLIS